MAIKVYNAANPEINPDINPRKPSYEHAVDMLKGIDQSSDYWRWKAGIHASAVEEFRVYIALFNNQAAGYLRFGSFLWDNREPFVQMVRTTEAARRQGVATALMNTFFSVAYGQAQTSGWEGAYSSTDVSNVASINLHHKLGYSLLLDPIKLPGQEHEELLFFKPFTPPVVPASLRSEPLL